MLNPDFLCYNSREVNKLFKRKKKKKTSNGKISSMIVNGAPAVCLSIRIFADEEGDKLDIYTKEPVEALHFDECEIELHTTDNRKLVLNVSFISAEKHKKLYHYLFAVSNYNEYFA